MYNRFKAAFLLLPLAMMFMAFPSALRSAQVSTLPVFERGGGLSGLSVTQTTTGYDLAWGWTGAGDPNSYNVTVTDMTTSTVLYSNTTSNKYITVTGLSYTHGHTIHFSVAALGYIVGQDIFP